jgi:uncharacterized protein YdbL (DUF1318 family)
MTEISERTGALEIDVARIQGRLDMLERIADDIKTMVRESKEERGAQYREIISRLDVTTEELASIKSERDEWRGAASIGRWIIGFIISCAGLLTIWLGWGRH